MRRVRIPITHGKPDKSRACPNFTYCKQYLRPVGIRKKDDGFLYRIWECGVCNRIEQIKIADQAEDQS